MQNRIRPCAEQDGTLHHHRCTEPLQCAPGASFTYFIAVRKDV